MLKKVYNSAQKDKKRGIIMEIKKGHLFHQLKEDLKNKTSHSVDYLLSCEVEKSLSKQGIKIRKAFSFLLRKVYKKQSKYKLSIEDNQPKRSNHKGKIYVLNHRQADDVVLGVNVVKDSGYIVFGNPYLALDTSNGLGLWAYGMILIDRNDPESRKSTYEKMKYVIAHGGNIIVWPEGYWNLDDDGLQDQRHGADDHNSENWLIQDINIGALRLAQEMNAPIIPTVLHYDETNGKNCYGTRGEEFYVSSDDDVFAKKDELLTIMRSINYCLIKKHSTYRREDLEQNQSLREQWETLKDELVSDCDIKSTGYKLDLADEKLIGKAKVKNPVTTNEEAFQHLSSIDPNKNNAFVLSKRLTGLRR